MTFIDGERRPVDQDPPYLSSAGPFIEQWLQDSIDKPLESPAQLLDKQLRSLPPRQLVKVADGMQSLRSEMYLVDDDETHLYIFAQIPSQLSVDGSGNLIGSFGTVDSVIDYIYDTLLEEYDLLRQSLERQQWYGFEDDDLSDQFAVALEEGFPATQPNQVVKEIDFARNRYYLHGFYSRLADAAYLEPEGATGRVMAVREVFNSYADEDLPDLALMIEEEFAEDTMRSTPMRHPLFIPKIDTVTADDEGRLFATLANRESLSHFVLERHYDSDWNEDRFWQWWLRDHSMDPDIHHPMFRHGEQESLGAIDTQFEELRRKLENMFSTK